VFLCNKGILVFKDEETEAQKDHTIKKEKKRNCGTRFPNQVCVTPKTLSEWILFPLNQAASLENY